MACYKIVWKQTARKELRKLPKATIVRIVSLVGALAENPVPPGVKKLAGTSHTYRIRTGNYRQISLVRRNQHRHFWREPICVPCKFRELEILSAEFPAKLVI